MAVLDSGGNPYLDIWLSEGVELPAAAHEVVLSSEGSVRQRFDADRPIWDAMEFHKLYHFSGTRLLAISFAQLDAPINYDGARHGAATTYLAAREAPSAIIVSVQVDPAYCIRERGCLINASAAEGMEWIADQPWIDIVSVSMGFPVPNHPDLHPEYVRYLAASERAARDGKLIVNSAGNSVVSEMAGYFSGPPWVVAVGGAESRASGESLLAAKGVDVVANFTDLAPKVLSEDLEYRSGTSFATPIVAGTLAHALHLVREADPQRVVTPQELRDALNASATYFDTTSWRPTWSDQDPLAPLFEASLPVLVQPQMGWGYVDGGLAPEIARRVLENDLAPPPEKAQAMLFQAQWQKAREEYWKSWPRR